MRFGGYGHPDLVALAEQIKALRSYELAELRKLLGWDEGADCEHEWVDMRNSVIESGECCRRCGVIRAGNAATA